MITREKIARIVALTIAVQMFFLHPAIGAAQETDYESIERAGRMFLKVLSAQTAQSRGMDAIDQLRELGFDVNEQTLDEIKAKEIEALLSFADGIEPNDDMQQMIDNAIEQVETDMQHANIYDILMKLGMGDMDYKTGEWTPRSNQVYAFDAEVMFVDIMYTQFLQGVQSIVSDIEITDIREDLSGLTDDLTDSGDIYAMPTDGKRTVSFLCNGHPYSIELDSCADWINGDIFDFMNQVLEKEGCQKRLHVLTDKYDQMVMMIYDTAERAEMIRSYVGTPW